jgi:hypothetical protein
MVKNLRVKESKVLSHSKKAGYIVSELKGLVASFPPRWPGWILHQAKLSYPCNKPWRPIEL